MVFSSMTFLWLFLPLVFVLSLIRAGVSVPDAVFHPDELDLRTFDRKERGA